ncbi:MAG: hypothetical protein J5967_04410, partial [Oscillospiraceae bacterium]|nr:hypothetical protein [Oscillospiraceae bacterium]
SCSFDFIGGRNGRAAEGVGPYNGCGANVISALKRLVNREAGTNIWQRSYYDHVIRGEADYREIWTYIDTNPARWAEDCYYSP